MTTTELAPDFREAISDPTEFSSLVERRNALKASIAEMEQEIKETLDPAITAILTDNDTVKVQYGELTVQLTQGRRSTLSKERLVEAGVAATVIESCTTVTTYSYLLVR